LINHCYPAFVRGCSGAPSTEGVSYNGKPSPN